MITQLFALLHKFHTLSATNQWCPVTKWGIIYWAKRFSDRILLLHPTITSFSNIPHKLVFVNQTPLCLSRAASGETFSDPTTSHFGDHYLLHFWSFIPLLEIRFIHYSIIVITVRMMVFVFAVFPIVGRRIFIVSTMFPWREVARSRIWPQILLHTSSQPSSICMKVPMCLPVLAPTSPTCPHLSCNCNVG